MANLKEIRNRISSVSSTMQITSAMKMVSAAKLKKAQDAITAMRPYAAKLTELLQNLSGAVQDGVESPYTKVRPVKRVLYVAITSNRGLCGGFNSNVIKEVKSRTATADAASAVFTLGKKGNDILSKEHEIVGHNTAIFDSLNYSETAVLAQELMDGFAAEAYDEVHLVYNRFKNAATQTVTVEQFLPLVPQKTDSQTHIDYIYEPGQEEIFTTLLPKALKMQLFKALRDSFASEHGARMTAMHKATDNATDLRNQLKLTYNKARQAAITNEILEIVGGAEALNG
jgi:F-type H+-transporting ATPase subunit gamma